MSEFGFISGRLEIKFLILYIAARVAGPVPFEVLQELSMCDAGVDYFNFSECLADLNEQGLYAITEKGLRNSAATESSLPYTVRVQVEQNLVGCNEQLKRKALVGAQVEERKEGGYTVTLSMSDELDDLMQLRLLITRRDLALEVQKRFRANAEEIFQDIIDFI